MGRICEHELKNGVEYDLYAQLQLTIRYRNGRFEIGAIHDESDVHYSYGTLAPIIRIANELEGAENTIEECSPYCPVSQKLVHKDKYLNIRRYCSNCGAQLVTEDDGEHESFTYCPSCGDW